MKHLFLGFALCFATPAVAAPLCFCLKCGTQPETYRNLYAPSMSMAPAFMPDQCMVGRRVADPATLERGDVMIFEEDSIMFYFRLIGLPGDTVQMVDGAVVLNGQALPQQPLPDHQMTMARSSTGGFPQCANGVVAVGDTCLKHRARETLPSGRSYEVLNIGDRSLDNTALFTVPEGHVFVLGDNRDNAADSRAPRAARGRGFVSFDQIWGIVE